ncbi:MAG: energy transducer TonB [Hyphomicrobiales bacterium]
MKPKKNPKADLESKRFVFNQIGLIIALVIVFIIFQIRSYSKRELSTFDRENVAITEEMIPITEHKKEPPPPKKQKTIAPVFKVVEEVEEEQEIEIDAEADQETVIVDAPIVMDEEPEIKEDEIFVIVEKMPNFPGGLRELNKYLARNIKYPIVARESGIQGKVYLAFVVEPDGSISNIKLLRGIGGGCDEEAIRVIKNMPKWDPGKQRNKPVRVSYQVPVCFTLQ